MRPKHVVVGAIAMAAVTLAGFAAGVSVAQESTSRVYELRTYTTLPGRLPALHKRFAEHTLKLFKKHSMRNETYWVPTDSARKDNTLIYIVSHSSQDAADKSWKEYATDPEWIKVRNASEADGAILAKSPERVFMRRTGYSP